MMNDQVLTLANGLRNFLNGMGLHCVLYDGMVDRKGGTKTRREDQVYAYPRYGSFPVLTFLKESKISCFEQLIVQILDFELFVPCAKVFPEDFIEFWKKIEDMLYAFMRAHPYVSLQSSIQMKASIEKSCYFSRFSLRVDGDWEKSFQGNGKKDLGDFSLTLASLDLPSLDLPSAEENLPLEMIPMI